MQSCLSAFLLKCFLGPNFAKHESKEKQLEDV